MSNMNFLRLLWPVSASAKLMLLFVILEINQLITPLLFVISAVAFCGKKKPQPAVVSRMDSAPPGAGSARGATATPAGGAEGAGTSVNGGTPGAGDKNGGAEGDKEKSKSAEPKPDDANKSKQDNADKKDDNKSQGNDKKDDKKDEDKDKKVAYPSIKEPTPSVKKKREEALEKDKKEKIEQGFYQSRSDEDDTLEKIKSLKEEASESRKKGASSKRTAPKK